MNLLKVDFADTHYLKSQTVMSSGKKTKLFFFILTVVFFSIVFPCRATHIVGGELNYRYLGNNRYEIRLTVYRDCYNGIPPFDDPASIGIFDKYNNLISYSYQYTGFYPLYVQNPPYYNNVTFYNDDYGFLAHVRDSASVPNAINSPCLIPPTDVCYRVAHYIDTLTLPPRSGGYQLAYQRCCRNNTILNITDPGATGATYYAKIPDTSVVKVNSNPVFKKLPPTFICVNTPFTFDHSAVDYDGDSLVYEICMPWHGASTTFPLPQPPNNPPYSNVNWKSPYSLSNVLGGVPMKIDSKTGLLTATPNTMGQFVYAVCVQEYRKGVWVGETRRDFQVNVVNCPNIVVSSIQAPSLVCGTTQANFINNSVGATSYSWDFGVSSSTQDTSKAKNPTYFYPDTGLYRVRLVAYSGINPACNDTSYSYVRIASGLNGNFELLNNGCSKNAMFRDSSYSGSGKVNYWLWNFGDAGTSLLQNPAHTYAATGTYNVTLITATADGCRDTVTKPVIISPLPEADFNNTGNCSKNATFTDASTVSTGSVTAWSWDFGDLTSSSQKNPVHSYSSEGSYTVILIASSALGCKDTITKNITVITTPKPDFTNVPVCLNDTSRFVNTSSISNGTIIGYSWNFGDNTSSVLQNPVHVYSSMANYTVTLVATSSLGCKDSISKMIALNPLPVAGFTNTPVCQKNDVVFTDASAVSNGKIIDWSWNFGDTTTSAVPNPVHAFDSVETMNIILIVKSASGCKDTIVKAIDVNPLPVIKFSGTTVCLKDTTRFTDASTVNNAGITAWLWNFGDSTFSSLQNPIHVYNAEGTHAVTLTATSSKGCKDSLKKPVNIYSLPLADAGAEQAVCNGDSTQLNATGGIIYYWQPVTGISNPAVASPWVHTTITSVYMVKVTDGNNCSKTDSVTVKVNALPVFSAGPDVWLCPGDTVVITTSGKPFFTYNWQPSSSLINFNTSAPSAFPSVTTDYIVTVTDSNGCLNKDTMNVKVNPLVPTDAGNDTTVCAGVTVRLGGEPTAPPWSSYSWQPSAGLNGAYLSNPVVTPASTTTYYVATSNDTCHGSDTVTVFVNPRPKADYTANPVCLNGRMFFIDSSQISSGNIIRWSWNFGNSDSSVLQNPSYLFAAAGTHLVQLITGSVKGCNDTIRKTVVVFPLPATEITQSFNVTCNKYCDGQAITATKGGTPTYFYIWNDGQTDSVAKQLCAKQYSVEVKDKNLCVSRDSIVITEPEPLQLFCEKTDVVCFGICDGTATVAQGGASGGTIPYAYLWSNAETKSSVKNLCPGTYFLTLTDANQCKTSDTVIINDNLVKPVITTTADRDTLIRGETTNLLADVIPNTGYNYRWMPVTGLNNPASSTPSATLFTSTTFYVTAADKNNCIVKDSISIFVINASCNEKDVFVPNAFTPDDDGHNDILSVKGKAVTDLYFAIYNRWGELVFETKNIRQGWDGTYKSAKAAPDVFVYYLKAKCFDGEEFFRKGNITLIR